MKRREVQAWPLILFAERCSTARFHRGTQKWRIESVCLAFQVLPGSSITGPLPATAGSKQSIPCKSHIPVTA